MTGALHAQTPGTKPGNPAFPGWYADPEGHFFEGAFWIYPTSSLEFDQQVYFDAFSSPDLIHWTKHPRIVDTSAIKWAKRAMWAPSVTMRGGKYYFFFSSDDIHHNGEQGGLGIAVSDHPGGPFSDYLGKPLLNHFHQGAQPIDPQVFQDRSGDFYLIYGGWGHCLLRKLNDDFTDFSALPDGNLFKEITPKGYVEGPFVFVREGKYYFMWSEGNWTDSTYNVAYAMGDSLLGPFDRIGDIIEQNPSIASGAGHNSVLKVPGKDAWLFIYHRRPPGTTSGNDRVVCIEKMLFNPDGTIKPIEMTNTGVGPIGVE